MFKTVIYTILAVFAFAGNSVLCRMALMDNAIDAASFTSIRLISGVTTLALIVAIQNKSFDLKLSGRGSWSASAMLFMYAVCFSFAYIDLDTGTGALILFGAVQLTMILMSVLSGNRLSLYEVLGFLVAFLGFIYLILPSISTPSVMGFILMIVAGISWAGYSLIGRGSVNPLLDTASNFIRTLPLVVLLFLFSMTDIQLSLDGFLLAVMSGAVASGIGYAIWYRELQGLLDSQAAVVQLLVPVLAAVGGVLFSNEEISLRLVIAAILVLGGVTVVIFGKKTVLKP